MTQLSKALLEALKVTAQIVALLAAAVILLTVIIGPFVLIVGFDGPTWAGVLAVMWAIVSFIFTLALLNEL
jgi:hypothetical protein